MKRIGVTAGQNLTSVEATQIVTVPLCDGATFNLICEVKRIDLGVVFIANWSAIEDYP